MTKYIFLGMAAQAAIVAVLTRVKWINPTPAQQFIAASLFLLMAILSWSLEGAKIK